MKNVAKIAAMAFALSSTSALAVSVTGVSNADGASTLVSALLGANSGITVTSSTYVGADNQGGTYTDFGSVADHGDGIILSTGSAIDIPNTNTSSSWDQNNAGKPAPETLPGGASDDIDLVQILLDSGNDQAVNDVNFLEFTFTLDDPTQDSIIANFVYGTDEFPSQSITDIFGFFVDGVNYATFEDGSLINFELGGPNVAFYNDNTTGAFPIEWDGITDVLAVTGILDDALVEHTAKIAIADTTDVVFDSAVYLASLSGTVAEGDADEGGITAPPPPVPVVPDPVTPTPPTPPAPTPPSPTPVPLPAGFLLLGGAVLALGAARRRKPLA